MNGKRGQKETERREREREREKRERGRERTRDEKDRGDKKDENGKKGKREGTERIDSGGKMREREDLSTEKDERVTKKT